ncbi:unnamed protein product [Laminaria digitata]
MVSAVLEAVARGRAGFAVRALVEDTGEETTAGGPVNSGPRGEETPLGTQKPSRHPASTGAASQGQEGKTDTVVSQERKDDTAVVSKAGGVLRGGGPGKGEAGVVGITRAPGSNFRCNRPIDGDIMGTLVAEVTPLAEPGYGKGGGGADGSAEDAFEVYGPEMEWRSMGDTVEVDDDAIAVVMEALEKVKEEGFTLVQLKRVVREAARLNGAPAEEVGVKSFIARALRNGTIVSMCGAQDMRYMLEDHAKGWGIPSPRGADPLSDKPRASPTPMETETAGEEEDDAANSAAAAAKGWKGKGKQRAGKACRNRVAPASESGSEAKVLFPWMTFDGEVNVPLLNRIRYGLLSYTRKNPGRLASKIREAEVPFLTEGETTLLLRDLVRREVLREQTVPDVSTATLSGGWGVACNSAVWAKGRDGILHEEAEAGLTTSYSPTVNWADTIKRIKGMPLSSFT